MEVNAARAADAYRALQRYLAVNDGSGLYRERYPAAPDDRPYSYEWPYSQAHAATLDLTGIPGAPGAGYLPDLAARAAGQERYWRAEGGTTGLPGYASYPVAPYGAGGDLFYDDNAWVGLLSVQKHLMWGDPQDLACAERIFDLIVSGWDSDPRHAAPGGVFWTQASWSRDRNTVSTMPAAELGLRLHLSTGGDRCLEWARRMDDWATAYLCAPQGLYWDHLDLAGTVDTTFWSYNQGVPVGVCVLLHRITGDERYLERARRTAEAATALFGRDGFLGQPPYFNAIHFKNLLLLDAATGAHTHRDLMAAYAGTVWERYRDPATGLFRFDAAGGTETLQQAAMVQIFSVLAWDSDRHWLLY